VASIRQDGARPATRRRGAVLEEAIVAAAWEELAERGWAGFGIEGVSTRCGTAKAVVYRRWRNRVELVQDMLARITASPYGAHRSSGDLRTDLIGFLRDMAGFLDGPYGEAVRGSMYEGDPSKRASVLVGPVVVGRVDRILEDAVARGELPRMPSPAAANLGHAVAMSEFLHTGAAPSGHAIDVLVDELWLPALEHPHDA
jgi:AcrR family transcriptional regulator